MVLPISCCSNRIWPYGIHRWIQALPFTTYYNNNGNNLNLDYSLWIWQDQLILKCYYWVHITQTCFLYCLYLHIMWSMEHSSQQLYQTISRLTHSVEKGSSFSHKRHTVNHWPYAKCQGYHRRTSHAKPSYW